jgi:hypothetical protein
MAVFYEIRPRISRGGGDGPHGTCDFRSEEKGINRNLTGVFLVLSAVTALLPALSPGQTPPVGRILIYSLEPGEEIMSAESTPTSRSAISR